MARVSEYTHQRVAMSAMPRPMATRMAQVSGSPAVRLGPVPNEMIDSPNAIRMIWAYRSARCSTETITVPSTEISAPTLYSTAMASSQMPARAANSWWPETSRCGTVAATKRSIVLINAGGASRNGSWRCRRVARAAKTKPSTCSPRTTP
jgi:hypothetical protein